MLSLRDNLTFRTLTQGSFHAATAPRDATHGQREIMPTAWKDTHVDPMWITDRNDSSALSSNVRAHRPRALLAGHGSPIIDRVPVNLVRIGVCANPAGTRLVPFLEFGR